MYISYSFYRPTAKTKIMDYHSLSFTSESTHNEPDLAISKYLFLNCQRFDIKIIILYKFKFKEGSLESRGTPRPVVTALAKLK